MVCFLPDRFGVQHVSSKRFTEQPHLRKSPTPPQKPPCFSIFSGETGQKPCKNPKKNVL